jgi:hypothetical protein
VAYGDIRTTQPKETPEMLWQTSTSQRHIVLHGVAATPMDSFGYADKAEPKQATRLDRWRT